MPCFSIKTIYGYYCTKQELYIILMNSMRFLFELFQRFPIIMTLMIVASENYIAPLLLDFVILSLDEASKEVICIV
jgi:hypothetical protein